MGELSNGVLNCAGSRDGCLGVWDTRFESNIDRLSDSDVLIKKPIGWLTSIHEDERFRAIQYNPSSNVCTIPYCYDYTATM